MDFLQESFVKHTDRILLTGDVSATYGELSELIHTKIPMERRSLVILAVSEGTNAVLAYLACVLQGLVVLPVPESLGSEQLRLLVDTYQPKYLLAKHSRNLQSLEAKFRISKKQLLSCEFDLYEAEGVAQKLVNSDLRLLLSTSGTTGDPKLVKLSEKNLLENTEAICKSIDIKSSDSVILTLPLNYSFGLSVIHSHIFSGSKIVCVSESIINVEFWRKFEENDVTSLYGVPYQFEMLKKLRIFKRDLSNIRYFAQAGGHLSDSVKRWFLDQCIMTEKSFFIMYGQTECAPRISTFDVTGRPDKFDSVGLPVSCCDVIAGDSKINPSEIVVTGANVFSGYASNAFELRKECEKTDHSHATGDLGYLDDDGFLYICGRLKRFIKVYGHNVNLDHLESRLNDQFNDIAVAGTENKIGIFFTNGSIIDETIVDYLEEQFAFSRQAILVQKITEFPRLSNGKIDYKTLELRVVN